MAELNFSKDKKLILSMIQPTGTFTLGNYLGAVKNWGPLQEEFNCVYAVADLHSITVTQEPAKLRQNSLQAYALLIACGMDPQKSVLFFQSHNCNHPELSWVLGCSTQFGELQRMTQFKDKSAKHADNINAGLFTYPVLMAADILAYNADLVPIGADQKQHLELARNIAQRFNQRYGDFFKLPEPYIPKMGAKVMSLQDPTKKMSKSDENPNACILILDDKDTIIRKFKRAVTDSDTEVRYAEGKDGINNLMTIYSVVTGKSFEDIEKDFAGKGYGDFKLAVGEAVADHLEPVRTEFARLMNDKAYLKECYTAGAEKARIITQRTVSKVYHKVGFVDPR
ncbi:tryptophan--tRNA ligase [uncultured Ruminococcus sp.]|uniref:tryptophan--tRNA ligase n=1 Tax=uncultured Ruminococcus sp. TaxID=165186 RepID=UPI000EEF539A|nr:tryptophan--tRNA ligase [uncultured Ruminococcus sp.]HCJ41218.1 tryptophan--tRNA ligase [Ruminococcus sp.]